MFVSGLKRPEAAATVGTYAVELQTFASRLLLRPVRCGAPNNLFRDCPASRAHGRRGRSFIAQSLKSTLLSTSGGPRQSATTTAPSQQRTSRTASSTSGGGGDNNNKNNDPEDEADSSNDSFQIGLDPFSQQLIASALTAGAAWIIAAWAHLDLLAALRPEGEALGLALQLSAPVLLLLLAVLVPRWAPPFKGSELSRLQHNYYMTAQVLQLYLDFDDEDEEEGSSAANGVGSGGNSVWEDDSGGGSGGERARVRRRLRLEQTVGWGTVSSGLALMQAFTLQPWNPPTSNSVFGLALAGRTASQLANEFLIRGAGWGLLSAWVAGELQSADASDGILFFGKVFGGPDAVKYAAGLSLVALALPGALWEARAVRNFVRSSVVGPVRDAAIFCTGNGVDEPAYCDPAGFAMLAARRPANRAPVADVVTRTRGWRSGPQASFTSVSSMGSVDLEDLQPPPAEAAAAAAPAAAAQRNREQHDGTAAASSSAAAAHLLPPNSTAAVATASGAEAASTSSSSSPLSASSPPSSSSSSSSPPASSEHSNHHPSTPAHSTDDAAASSSPPFSSASSASPSSPASASSSSTPPPSIPASPPSSPQPPPPPPPLPAVGPTLSTSSTAFEWDSEDMGVLLKVETLQDKVAAWLSLYYQLLAAFAINGAFLASDCNLLASFATAWMLRTGPLLLAELRARRAGDAATR